MEQLEITLGVTSDERPAEVDNLLSGRHDVNLNIKENTFTDEFTKEERTVFTYDSYRVKSMSITSGELINALVREKYTDSEEFSLLRQKETKAEEYAAYNAYCEECKTLGKTIWGKLHNES